MSSVAFSRVDATTRIWITSPARRSASRPSTPFAVSASVVERPPPSPRTRARARRIAQRHDPVDRVAGVMDLVDRRHRETAGPVGETVEGGAAIRTSTSRNVARFWPGGPAPAAAARALIPMHRGSGRRRRRIECGWKLAGANAQESDRHEQQRRRRPARGALIAIGAANRCRQPDDPHWQGPATACDRAAKPLASPPVSSSVGVAKPSRRRAEWRSGGAPYPRSTSPGRAARQESGGADAAPVVVTNPEEPIDARLKRNSHDDQRRNRNAAAEANRVRISRTNGTGMADISASPAPSQIDAPHSDNAVRRAHAQVVAAAPLRRRPLGLLRVRHRTTGGSGPGGGGMPSRHRQHTPWSSERGRRHPADRASGRC